MKNPSALLILVLITFSLTVTVVAVKHSNPDEDTKEKSISDASLSGTPMMDSTVRTWQATALQRARQKLLEMEDELDKSRNARFCEQKRKRMLRRLYWQKRTIRCPRSYRRNANSECKKKWGLKKRISYAQKRCGRNKNCLAKHAWPLQWKLRMVNRACECTRLWKMMRNIWRVKAIKCPRSRNVWEIKHDIHDLERKIEYLEKFVHAKPSVAPRAKWED